MKTKRDKLKSFVLFFVTENNHKRVLKNKFVYLNKKDFSFVPLSSDK